MYRQFYRELCRVLSLLSLALPGGHEMKVLMLHYDVNFVSDFYQSRSRVMRNASGRATSELVDCIDRGETIALRSIFLR